jgi:threonyl-tRNA synthetase
VKPGAVISVYRVGPMVDLCRGPHLPNTAALKAVAVTNASRAFWRGDTSKDGLQRVYGIAFTDKKVLHSQPKSLCSVVAASFHPIPTQDGYSAHNHH